MRYLLQQGGFVIQYRYLQKWESVIRKLYFSILGMGIGRETILPKIHVSWPHQVLIGKNCKLEKNIYFKFDGIWMVGPSIIIGDNVFIGSGCEFNIRKSISIGKDTLIASGCRFIDYDHGLEISQLMRVQRGPEKEIKVGNDVWLGCNVVVLKGVNIGDGAVIAAGAVVTKSVPNSEIWAGVPARKVGERK